MEKEFARKIDEGIGAATRIADALEKLVNEPLVEIKTPPPQCPHCGKINPIVRIYHIPEGQGQISRFLVQAQCTHCDRDVYCITLEWSLQPDEDSARMLANEVNERMNRGIDV